MGARRVGVLVGVELDQVGELGLLAGDIGRQVVDDGAPEAAHGRSARRQRVPQGTVKTLDAIMAFVHPVSTVFPGKPRNAARRNIPRHPRDQDPRQDRPRRQRARVSSTPASVSSTTCSTRSPATAASTWRSKPSATSTRRPPHRRGCRHHRRPGLCEGGGRQEGPDPLWPRLFCPSKKGKMSRAVVDLSGRPGLEFEVPFTARHDRALDTQLWCA